LIKNTHPKLPIYFLSLFHIPIDIVKRIENFSMDDKLKFDLGC